MPELPELPERSKLLRTSALQLIETDRLLGAVDVPMTSSRSSVVLVTSSRDQSTNLANAAPVQQQAATIPTRIPSALGDDKVLALQTLRESHDQECEHCTTARAHTQIVFGEGNPDADIFFVGEAPGETEDRVGRPFVGRAGAKLDEMIRAIGLRREDCYIANVLKSRPPENRTPLPLEVERCGPYLEQQLIIVRPKVIVTLGGPATKLLLKVDVGISKLRGVWSVWTPPPASGIDPIALMPTYHPAYLLRNYTLQTRSEVWADLKSVIERVTR